MLAWRIFAWFLLGLLLFLCFGLSCSNKAEKSNVEKSTSAAFVSTYPKLPSDIQEKSAWKKQPDHQPGVLLIKFKQDYLRYIDQNYAVIMKELGLERSGPRNAHGLDVVTITTKESALQASARLSRDVRIEYAEPNWRIGLFAVPNDPLFENQWSLHNTGQVVIGDNGFPILGIEGADIDAVEAWDMTSNSLDEIIVAILDTGIAYDHADLATNMWVNQSEQDGQPGVDDDGNGLVDDIYGWNFAEDNNNPYDYETHGTHLAGIVAAVGNDNYGIVGVAWNARVKIMSLRVMRDNQPPSGFVLDAVEAFDYAVNHGAKIINCSWWTLGRKSQALHDAVTSAENHGVVVVSAAGNFFLDNDEDDLNTYPAEYENDNVISVAATDNRDRAARFTNWGRTSVDVAAPGVGILSTINTKASPDFPEYLPMSGTSIASPIVAGAIAVMLQQKPDLIVEQGPGSFDFGPLREALFSSIEPISDLEDKTVTGGRINLLRALQYIEKQDLPPIAKIGGTHMRRVGEEVIVDGSGSFDPEGVEISAYEWSLKAPEHSHAQLDTYRATAKFVPDVCGYYEITLSVEAGAQKSDPNVVTVLAMNWQPLKTPIETRHPYPFYVFYRIGRIVKPGATLIAAHFKRCEFEHDSDFLVFMDDEDVSQIIYYDFYTGKRGEFTGPVYENHAITLGLLADSSISLYGFVSDSYFWCNQNSTCSQGTGDCDLDPLTGEGGCEIDLTSDPENCGWCEHSCSLNGVGGVCVEGKCVSTDLICFDGYMDCNQESYDGCETYLSEDIDNCGECGRVCDLANVSSGECVGGTCQVVTCVVDWANDIHFENCNGISSDGCEIDLMHDSDNCGECHRKCAMLDPDKLDNVEAFSGDCGLGECELVCKPGWYDCNQLDEDGCESDLSDSENCGECGHRCAYSGAEGICVDPTARTCAMGSCLPGFDDCDQASHNGCETGITQDPSNCGVCGNVCPQVINGTTQCAAGSCILQCDFLFQNCDNDIQNGCEVDVRDDVTNCGTCGNVCMPFANAASVCNFGSCQMSCNESFMDCDGSIGTGCEIDIHNDPKNCGGCEKQCIGAANADAACEQGGCTIACKNDFGNCDDNAENGCEIDLSQSISHCGACNTMCEQKSNATPLCDKGDCILNCNNGWGDCNESESDGCEAKLDDKGKCPEEDNQNQDGGGCHHTDGSPRSLIPMLLFMLGGLLWLRRCV